MADRFLPLQNVHFLSARTMQGRSTSGIHLSVLPRTNFECWMAYYYELAIYQGDTFILYPEGLYLRLWAMHGFIQVIGFHTLKQSPKPTCSHISLAGVASPASLLTTMVRSSNEIYYLKLHGERIHTEPNCLYSSIPDRCFYNSPPFTSLVWNQKTSTITLKHSPRISKKLYSFTFNLSAFKKFNLSTFNFKIWTLFFKLYSTAQIILQNALPTEL